MYFGHWQASRDDNACRVTDVGEPAPAQGRVVLVGYGSVLRGDDAVGQRVVQELWRQRSSLGELASAKFVLAECLVPEMALDVTAAGLVVFADAACDGRTPGEVKLEWLASGARQPVAMGCWQDLSPEVLVSLAGALYDAAPPALLVSIGVAHLGLGEGLSPPARAAVPQAAAAVRRAIGAWARAGRQYPFATSMDLDFKGEGVVESAADRARTAGNGG
jgi:hydrogenase maturation protease